MHIEIVDRNTNTWSRLPGTDPETRAAIKQGWWRQFINKDLLAKYPKLKGASFFEFIKREDGKICNFINFVETIRDFTNLGRGYEYITPLKQDAGIPNNATLAAFQADIRGGLGDLILWADGGKPVTGGIPITTLTGTTPNSQVGIACANVLSIILALGLIL